MADFSLVLMELTSSIKLKVALWTVEQAHLEVAPLVVLLVAPSNKLHWAEEATERFLPSVGFDVVLKARIVAKFCITILASVLGLLGLLLSTAPISLAILSLLRLLGRS